MISNQILWGHLVCSESDFPEYILAHRNFVASQNREAAPLASVSHTLTARKLKLIVIVAVLFLIFTIQQSVLP